MIDFEKLTFDAIDKQGKRYYFNKEKTKNGYLLTLKKETILNAKKLYLFPTLSKAKINDDGYYILPRNIDMIADSQVFFNEKQDGEFTYNRPIMACYFIKKKDFSCLIRLNRDYNFYFTLSVKNGEYSATPLLDFTENEDIYFQHEECYTDIKAEVIIFEKGTDYNIGAKTERELRLDRNEIIPLIDKCKKPATEYARKNPLIRIRMGWKPSPATVLHQTLENEPEMFVACTFSRVRDIIDELTSQGVTGAEIQLVGWNISGHDGRYPQIFPVDNRLGGEEELIKTINYAKEKGFLISTHTNLLDATEIADTFDINDIVLKRNGERAQIGLYSGGLSYRVCASQQLKVAKRDYPRLASLGENGLHFVDVISIVVPDACYDKRHPLHTPDAIIKAQEIMGYVSGLFNGFSSEGCFDFSLKHLDYGLYTSFGLGFGNKGNPICDRLVPFFEIAYHGIVLYNPLSDTINFTIKSPADKLTLIMRGGRASFYFFSKFRTGGEPNWMGENDITSTTNEDLVRAVSAIKEGFDICRDIADIQCAYMLDYQFLGNGIEVAKYDNGISIVGNFLDKENEYNGKKIAPYSYVKIKD